MGCCFSYVSSCSVFLDCVVYWMCIDVRLCWIWVILFLEMLMFWMVCVWKSWWCKVCLCVMIEFIKMFLLLFGYLVKVCIVIFIFKCLLLKLKVLKVRFVFYVLFKVVSIWCVCVFFISLIKFGNFSVIDFVVFS